MFLKDLKYGDFILSSNGKYQPYLLSPHSNPSKPTRFIQIYTDDAKNTVPLEVTPGHMVFLHDKNVPVQAGKIKVGDVLVGVTGPKTVTKLNSSITRNGFYNALTGDGTLIVDGILASSNTALNEEGEEYVNFGPFKVHVHTLVSSIGAPLVQLGCSKVSSFFCKTQVDDGSGGTLNVLISSGRFILSLPAVLQSIIFPALAALAAIVIVLFYLAIGLATQKLAQQFEKKVKVA